MFIWKWSAYTEYVNIFVLDIHKDTAGSSNLNFKLSRHHYTSVKYFRSNYYSEFNIYCMCVHVCARERVRVCVCLYKLVRLCICGQLETLFCVNQLSYLQINECILLYRRKVPMR